MFVLIYSGHIWLTPLHNVLSFFGQSDNFVGYGSAVSRQPCQKFAEPKPAKLFDISDVSRCPSTRMLRHADLPMAAVDPCRCVKNEPNLCMLGEMEESSGLWRMLQIGL